MKKRLQLDSLIILLQSGSRRLLRRRVPDWSRRGAGPIPWKEVAIMKDIAMNL